MPRRAVLGRLGAKFVYVQTEPLHFGRREVVTGMISGDRVEIVEGVLPGDIVVTNGHYQLQYSGGGESAGTTDGHDHAAAAVADGAVALLVERPLDLPVPQLLVPDSRAAMAPLADSG